MPIQWKLGCLLCAAGLVVISAFAGLANASIPGADYHNLTNPAPLRLALNPQPEPPGMQRAPVDQATIVKTYAKVLSALPPGPCKGQSYFSRHFQYCMSLLPVLPRQ